MNGGIEMNSPCETCLGSTAQTCINARHTLCLKEMEYCETCGLFFEWDIIPNENIKTTFESRGEFWGAPCSEEVVVGWVCPGCGGYNSM
jgi:hypothetical protein